MKKKSLLNIEFDHTIINSIDKKHELIGVFFYIYYILTLITLGIVKFKTPLYGYINNEYLAKLIFNMLIIIITITPIVTIMIMNKKGFETIGLKLNKMKMYQSISIGIVGGIPFSILNIIGGIQEGNTLEINLPKIFINFIYYLFYIAFVEELIFRGFIQIHILKLIKSKWTSIFFVGVLFSLSHVPFMVIKYNINVYDFVKCNYIYLIILFFKHIYYLYLYTRYETLITPIIAHTLIDFSYSLFVA
jgi:membrane protease YdiL (CAAX protease family)